MKNKKFRLNTFLVLMNYAIFKSQQPIMFAISYMKMLFLVKSLAQVININIGCLDEVIELKFMRHFVKKHNYMV